MNKQLNHDDPVHPGEVIRSALARRNMTQAALAEASGLTQKHISHIVTCKSGIGTDAAVAIGNVLGISVRRLIRMQADYDVANHRRRPR